jgi:predicted O-methyltransferase YrrM
MSRPNRSRATIVAALDSVIRAVAHRAYHARQGAADVRLLVAEQLRRTEEEQNDPAGWIAFVRQASARQRHDVRVIRPLAGGGDEGALRLSTLIDLLGNGVPPLPTRIARELADAGDRVRGRRDPFVRRHRAGDVGLHSAAASSGGTQSRMLAAVVRVTAARRIIEIGTAYGLGTLSMARAAGPNAQIVTLERSEPQLSIARQTLAGEPNVHVIGAIAAEAIEEVADHLGGPANLLFHDGGHSREGYISDFAVYEPLLALGATVVFDDIHWVDRHSAIDPRTYEGWREVASHERVRAAWEIDGNWGLLLLR